MTAAREIRPTPYQSRILSIPQDYNIALLGGRGGGKTHAIMFLVIRHCSEFKARARVLITRRRLKSLIQMSEELRVMLRAAFGPSVSYNQNDNVFRLPNGATIALTHCESSSALADVAQGQNFSLCCVDEAGHGPDISVIDELGLALRAPGVPLRMVLSGNPGGPLHSVLASRYVTNRTPWVPFEFAENTWVLAASTIEDNPHLPEAYKRNFEVMRHTDPALYRAMRYGDWASIVGDYLQGIWNADRMVIDHHDLPPDCFVDLKLSIDWGSSAPCAVLLGGRLAVDVRLSNDRVLPKGAYVVYDEHGEVDARNSARGTGKTPSQIAPAIHEMCARNRVRARGVIDSAAEARTAGRAEASIADLFREAGVRVSPAKKGARVPRFEHLKAMMVAGDFYVASRCRHWLATCPSLPRDPRNPEDVDTTAVDHFWDATSYAIAGEASGRVTQRAFTPEPRMPREERIVWV